MVKIELILAKIISPSLYSQRDSEDRLMKTYALNWGAVRVNIKF